MESSKIKELASSGVFDPIIAAGKLEKAMKWLIIKLNDLAKEGEAAGVSHEFMEFVVSSGVSLNTDIILAKAREFHHPKSMVVTVSPGEKEMSSMSSNEDDIIKLQQKDSNESGYADSEASPSSTSALL